MAHIMIMKKLNTPAERKHALCLQEPEQKLLVVVYVVVAAVAVVDD